MKKLLGGFGAGAAKKDAAAGPLLGKSIFITNFLVRCEEVIGSGGFATSACCSCLFLAPAAHPDLSLTPPWPCCCAVYRVRDVGPAAGNQNANAQQQGAIFALKHIKLSNAAGLDTLKVCEGAGGAWLMAPLPLDSAHARPCRR